MITNIAANRGRELAHGLPTISRFYPAGTVIQSRDVAA